MRATDGSGDARGWVGLELESGSVGRSGATPTGGPHLAARQERRGGRGAGLGWGNRWAGADWALGEKKKRGREEKGEGDWAGWAES